MMINKHIKNFFMVLISAFILTGILTLETMAVEGNEKTIVSFAPVSEAEQKFYISKEDKPALEQLINVMPRTLQVYTDEAVWEELKVSWYCVGDDYETSDSYYFQFSPIWDDENYVVREGIEMIKDAPYIGVYFYDDVNAISVTGKSNETTIYNFLVNNMGLNTAAACGVLANIYAESGFNPNALGDSGTSYGICQWHSARWTAMKNWCNNNGHNWETLTGQLNYLKFELSANNSAYLYNGKTIYNYLKSVSNNAQGAYDAGWYWCYYFEVPANKETKSVTRGNTAKNDYWPEYSGVVDDTIIISGQNAPGTISKGNIFSISGTVSSGATLTNVTAGVFDVHGNMKTGKSASPNATSYNLKGLDPYVYFNHLDAGVYYYRVTASNAARTTTLVDAPFVILGNDRTVSDGTYLLASAGNTSYVVDVAGHSNASGANLELAESTGSIYQNFDITYVGNGYYTLRNSGSGKYMDVYGALSTSGTNVHQYDQNGGTAQNWQILPTGDGYSLVPECATACALDIVDGTIAAGTNVRVWTANLTAAQRFHLLEGDSIAPQITNVTVSDVTEDGYTVTCTVTDDVEVSKVLFPTWTHYNAQDDLGGEWKSNPKYVGTINGNTVTYRVKTSDHNNESGLYYTHIYAYDTAGNERADLRTAIALDGKVFEPLKTVTYGNHKYEIYGVAVDEEIKRNLSQWTGAKTYCESLGGYLASFETEEEWAYIKSQLLSGSDGYWLGATDEVTEGTWKWVNGNPLTFGDWAPGQPDNYSVSSGKQQHYLVTRYEGFVWDDDSYYPTTQFYGFVCEYEVQEATISYNANGGSGAPAAQTTTVGNEVTLSSKMPTRSGYKFIGWSTSATATVANYQPGETYTVEGNLTLYAIWIKTGTSNAPFSDVSNNAWYASAVQYVYENGIMSGNNGLFNPTGNITRAQVVATLYKLEGSPKVTDYSAVTDMPDVEAGQWYTDAVCWAYSVGVANGNSVTKKFNLNDPVTRQQLATFFYNYAKYKGLDITTRGDISGMAGADQVASYALDTVKWAVGTGLITGSETTVNGVTVKDLKPTGTATRAQVASIIMKFCQKNGL